MADNNITSNFRGIPIAELISAPLMAACESQKSLAASAFSFMKEIGFDNDKPRLLSFPLERPVGAEGITEKITVNAPFLGLIPLPALLIDDVQIDFQMEVTDTVTSKETSSSSADMQGEMNFHLGFFGSGKISMHGSVSSSRENTRSTNQTAKYQVHVSARQQQPTEGLSKLMDIMASCIEPVQSSK